MRRLEAGLGGQPPTDSLSGAEALGIEGHLRQAVHLLELETIGPATATYQTPGDDNSRLHRSVTEPASSRTG